jgi:hypothetical protein
MNTGYFLNNAPLFESDVGWVEWSETQRIHQQPRNVGLKNETQPTSLPWQ